MLIYHKAIKCRPLAEKSVYDSSCIYSTATCARQADLHRDEMSDDSDDVPNTELYCIEKDDGFSGRVGFHISLSWKYNFRLKFTGSRHIHLFFSHSSHQFFCLFKFIRDTFFRVFSSRLFAHLSLSLLLICLLRYSGG
jgi:hypothetical protein